MPLNFVGQYPNRNRIVTGLTSFDIAVSGNEKLGLPTRAGFHVYGNTGVGKTTFVLGIAGIIAGQTNKNIALSPIDTFDREIAMAILENAGMTDGTVFFELEDTDEKTTKNLATRFAEKNISAAILDSAAAISPISEQEGDPGDSNMGRRAKLLATFMKQIMHTIKMDKEDKVFFVTNHLYPNIGTVGNYTPGGRSLNYLTSIHIKLVQARVKNKAVKFDSGWLVEGTIDKNNYGQDKRKFHVFLMGGLGIHQGLTAVYDCINYGLASDGRKVSLNGESIASIKDMLANHEDTELFKPFFKALDEAKNDLISAKKVRPVKDDGEYEEKTIEKEGDELYGEEIE